MAFLPALMASRHVTAQNAPAVPPSSLAPAWGLPIWTAQGRASKDLTSRELLGQWVYLDFWASWCGPCKMFAPTFQASALKHTNEALHVKINTEDNQALSQRLSIRSIPTLAAYSKGKELTRVSGALPAPSLEQFVQRAILGV